MTAPSIGVWVGVPNHSPLITFYHNTIQVFCYCVLHRGQKVDGDCSVLLCKVWDAGPVAVSHCQW